MPPAQHGTQGLLRLLLDPSVNAKAWYVWFFGSYVAVGPFLNVFFQEVGLSRAQVGLIGALRPWISAPASFVWAALADRLGAHRAVLLSTYVASTATRMLLLWPRSFAGLMAVVLLTEVLAAPAGVLSDAAVMQICHGKESDYGKYRLWGAVGWGTFSTVAGWLISHLGIRSGFYTQALLSLPAVCHGARLYSRRKAGAHGGPPSAGEAATEAQPRRGETGPGKGGGGREVEGRQEAAETDPLLPVQADTLKQYDLAHRGMSASPSGSGEEGSASRPAGGDGGRKEHAEGGHGMGREASAEGGEGYWRRLWLLARRGEVLVFFVTATAMGYGFGTIDSFLFLHLKQMGATETLMGLTLTITCAAEVPAFQLQDRLLDRWGVTAVLDLTQAVYVLRLALYALLPWMGNVMWVLPVEVLHGITFACGWGAGTVNCKLLAPPGLAATLQGAFQGLYFGAGYGLGSLIGGWVGTRVGWQGMFACASVTMLGFWFAVLISRRLTGVPIPSAGRAGRDVEMI